MLDAAREHGRQHVRRRADRGRREGVLEQDRVLRRNQRGEIAVRHDGRERAAVLDRDEMRVGRLGEKVQRTAVGGIDLDDRLALDDEVGEKIAELRALVLDGLVGVFRRAHAGGNLRAAAPSPRRA